ncbi:DUF262 domain-containing HNH endonuclease family protein [Oceanobacillus caeni]|uniref:DUF262 domain-containing protein n=1 Tax=Oceanobacillus caeni TaxID=405946 RepID=UPI001C232596|nr:DUF262 domain-containing protein [Oceanobacillus caeni]MBU8791152.1 DUF262 domain-containing HNH endonuclease family protein [Oceanobacillus caeni]
MNINPESKPISEIFPIEGKSIYNIPIYQRNYSWNNNNIEELYNDVINEEAGYYIGNLLVTRIPNTHEFDVVDGQQRLTTIALFFLAIHEELTNIEKKYTESNEYGQIFALKADIQRKLRTSEGDPRLKLLESDAEIFKNYLQVLDGKPKGKFGNRTFGKRYRFIQDLIGDKEENNDGIDEFSKLNGLYNKLNNVELLRITVNDLTDAFSVFTSLNAKGLPLTLIDLLKSYYLSEAVRHFSEKEALQEWNKLISVFSDEDGEPNSTAVTQFLQNNYDAFEGEGTSSITKRASLRKYENLFKDNGYRYMDTLIIHAKIFSTIIPKIKNDEDIKYGKGLKTAIIKLSKLETSPVYPLMIYLLKELYLENVSEKTVESVFNYLVNFYVRRNIVLKPKSSNIRSKAIQTVRLLQKEDKIDDISLSVTQDTLGQISPSDEEFLSALKGSVYDISPQTVRFVLIELERNYGHFFNKQNKDTLDKYNNNGKPVWSLEHILPQNVNLKDSWKEMISPENIDLATNLQKENMHKLGNLTLTGYNTEMSDKSFVDKRDYQPSDSDEYTGLRTKLFINESIIREGETIENKKTWTIEDINDRTDKLANLILQEFPLD